MLRTSTVEEHTLVLLKRLQKLSFLSGTRLVGGTALALQIGHRKSIDLDFFGMIEEDGRAIAEILEENKFNASLESESKRIHVFKIEVIKVDMVNYPYHWLEPLVEAEGVRMAGLKDIAAMKLEAVANRGSKKDFVDLFFLLNQFSVQQMLEFYTEKFTQGSVFNVVRSLSYFEDAEPQAMPEMLIPVSWEEVKTTLRTAVEKL